MTRVILAILLLGSALIVPGERARADDDQMDRLRAAVARGEVRPLSDLLQTLGDTFPGKVVEVEIDEDDGRFVYEFKVLQETGRLLEIELDAATGAVIDVDGL